MNTRTARINKLISVIVVTVNRKKDLIGCLQSLQASDYRKIEIILIDNGSHYPVALWIKKLFPGIQVVRSKDNLGAAAGRNLGIKFAKGNYLLFVDDDAKVDKKMISRLIAILDKRLDIGMVQPKIYDMQNKKTLQGIGCGINLLTGRVSAIGIREKDCGQYDYIQEISAAGCIWMIKRKIIEEIGKYDECYFIPYEDLDFSFRTLKAGFKIYFVPQAIAWHKGIKSTFINPFLDYIGVRSTDRAYRIIRNKMIFIRKHSPWPKNIVFFFIILPFYIIIHSIVIMITWRLDILYQYWLGVVSGIWYSLSYSFKAQK